jgi:alpha-1,2-mannosyltransferase
MGDGEAAGRSVRIGWGLWALYALILSVVVAATPHRHTVEAYRDAAEAWSAKADLYELRTIHGFLYLPQAAAAFVPVTWFPYSVGQVLWRLAGLGLLAGAAWALARALDRRGAPWFLIFTLLLLPASFASARNGQSNVHLAACLLAFGVALLKERWNLATVFLMIALVLKPVAAVPILLVGALYGPMRLRLLAGLVVVALLPFLRPDWEYVLRQYHLCAQKMALAEEPGEHNFADFSGMLWTFGWRLPFAWIKGIGIVMAAATLGLAWRAVRIDRRAAPLWIAALAGTYLMLFNPRTETNSYIILAATALPFVADALGRRARGEAACLVFLMLALGSDSYGSPIYPWTNLWLKALVATGFLLFLAGRLIAGKALFGGRPLPLP